MPLNLKSLATRALSGLGLIPAPAPAFKKAATHGPNVDPDLLRHDIQAVQQKKTHRALNSAEVSGIVVDLRVMKDLMQSALVMIDHLLPVASALVDHENPEIAEQSLPLHTALQNAKAPFEEMLLGYTRAANLMESKRHLHPVSDRTLPLLPSQMKMIMSLARGVSEGCSLYENLAQQIERIHPLGICPETPEFMAKIATDRARGMEALVSSTNRVVAATPSLPLPPAPAPAAA